MGIKRITLAGVFAALITLLTYFPHITLPTGGYIHLGDSLIYTAAILYGGLFGGVTAGIGSMLADLMIFPTYALPTLIIKFIMGLIVGSTRDKKRPQSWQNILAMILGGLFMVVGYAVYEIIITGSTVGWLYNISMNMIQFTAGIAIGYIFLIAIKKTGILEK